MEIPGITGEQMDYNLQKYIAFITAVDNKSITAASEILNYSQSGISRMIGDLEKEWNISLLERNKYGVELTPDGQRLVPQIRALCNEFQKLSSDVDELQGLKTGLIRIGTISSIASQRLPECIRRYKDKYEAVKFEILFGDYNEIEDWVRSGRADFGFVILPTTKEFDVISAGTDGMFAILPKGHPLALKDAESVSIEDLAKEPFILQENDNNKTTRQFFIKHGISLQITCTTWDDYAIMAMVESGLGVSVLPELILKRCPYDIEIRRLKEGYTRELGIIMKDRNRLAIAVRRFLDYLVVPE